LAGARLGEHVHLAPVAIRGNEGGAVLLSSCCNPIPGDEIVGVITKGQGLVIHRANCVNAKRADPDKLLSVTWDAQKDRMFGATISVLARQERGALAEIATAISHASANIESVDTQDTQMGEGYLHIHFRIQVDSLAHLERVLAGIEGVVFVQRAERK
jgi:GTP pyrophosphokinase/guanosine-3',5'-bis(diphosphate) 3'-pyrophosphohydrolase